MLFTNAQIVMGCATLELCGSSARNHQRIPSCILEIKNKAEQAAT